MGVLRWVFDRRRMIGAAVLLGAVGVPAVAVGARLRARLPDPWNANRHVTLVCDAGEAPPRGAPLLRMEPSLAVIGVVEGPAPAGTAPAASEAVRISVFPEADGLLRDDSRLEVRVTSPDLLEIVTHYFTPERRALVSARIDAWRAAHDRAIDASLARLKELGQRDLGADELGRKLYEDEGLRSAVSGAFERRVIDPIDWNAVVERALASDAAASTGDLLKHVGPLSSGWAGLRAGYRSRWSRAFGSAKDGAGALSGGGGRTLDALRKGDPDEALLEAGGTLGDAIDRVNVTRVAANPQGWVLEQALSMLAPDPQAMKNAALRRAGENLLRALPERKDRIGKDFASLGKDLVERQRVAERAAGAVEALAGDAALRDDILRRYGPEARARVERFLGSVTTDPKLAECSRDVLDSGLELLAGVLRELALDDAGRGPNPLLVAFVRARLLNHREAVVILRSAGSGDPVSDGQVYVARRK